MAGEEGGGAASGERNLLRVTKQKAYDHSALTL
jgi:hypothetical protein